MLDPKILRKEKERVNESLKKRASDFNLTDFLEIDQKTRDTLSGVEELRSSNN